MAENPHYHGHRQRLKARYSQGGSNAIAAYELVELMLFLAIPRGDVKPLAKQLLSQFGNLAALINAGAADLKAIPGVGDNVVHVFSLFREVSLKQLQLAIKERTVLANWQQVVDYCTIAMAYEPKEQLRLLFLDLKNQLISDEVHQTGTINRAPIYPREIVKRALEVGASALILVHNHPTGDPTPSKADIDVTRQIAQVAKPLGILLYDHLIIGKGCHVSLKAKGLF